MPCNHLLARGVSFDFSTLNILLPFFLAEILLFYLSQGHETITSVELFFLVSRILSSQMFSKELFVVKESVTLKSGVV